MRTGCARHAMRWLRWSAIDAMPKLTDIFAANDGTWPAAEYRGIGPVTLRRGAGGGSRVSAATCNGALDANALKDAEAAMRAMGQSPRFQVRPGQDALDDLLAGHGYALYDPVTIYACPVGKLCDQPLPRVTALLVWEPLAIMREIWQAGGIGPERIAIMKRAKGPKTAVLGRLKDKPAGTAYAAMHDQIAMVHAVEVTPHMRRQGMAGLMMRAAALWARDQGARTLGLMCTNANQAANTLYASLGMEVVGQYHYRQLKEPGLL